MTRNTNTGATLRQDIISNAGTRARLEGRTTIGTVYISEWLECYNAPKAIAREHGITVQQMSDAIDTMDMGRLLAAIRAEQNRF